MDVRRVRKRSVVAAITLCASLAVHSAITALVVRFAPGDAEPPDMTVEMELTTSAEPPRATPPAVPDVVAAAALGARTVVTPSTHERHVTHTATSATGSAASIVLTALPALPAPATAANTVCTVRCDAGVAPLVLDPSAVALSSLGEDQRRESEDVASGAVAGEALSRYLGGVANARPWVTQRAPPELERSADGSYVYRSSRLNARIAPDGTVTFGDRPGVAISGPATPDVGIGLMGRFDVGEAVMEANGQDPLRAERAWFMRNTEDLRDHLAAHALHADGEHSLRALSARLDAIVADRSLSPATQRSRLFAAWDDCETDAIGARARALVTQFARDHFPAGSAVAYTAAELAAFNAHRVSREPFAPYG